MSVQAQGLTLEDFARHEQFIEVKISPTGQYLAATRRDADGQIELVVIDRQKMQLVSQRHFSGKDSIGGFDWANNERLMLNIAREGGALEKPVATGELFAMDANGKRSLFLTGVSSKDKSTTVSTVIDWLPKEEDNVVIAEYNWRNRDPLVFFHKLNIRTGRKSSLGSAPIRAVAGVIAALTDAEGYPRLVAGLDSKDNNKLIIMHRAERSGDWQTVASYQRKAGSFSPLAFSQDGAAVYGVSDATTNTMALAKLDIATGAETLLMVSEDADIFPIFSFKNGRAAELIGASFEYDQLGSHFMTEVQDKAASSTIQGLLAAFPNKAVKLTSATADNKLMILEVASANDPRAFYLFDAEKKQIGFLLEAAPWFANQAISQTQSITYKARDGQEIVALLTLPHDREAKNLPLVLMPHGGPHGVRDSMSAMEDDAKVLAAHGYAVLQPNFRGSGGFGKAFLTAGYKKWGTLMIDDMTDGVRHIIAQGIADERRVAVYGGSYGGYASLMSAIREPELYRCAINFVGMSDLSLMYKEGDTTEHNLGIDTLETYIGRSDEVLKGQSAIHNLDKLKAPVLIIHGAEDQRVPLVQAEVLRKAFDERGHPYEWLVKEKEGHGFYKPENNVERWQRMLAFLEKHMAI
ncbi:MAG TPA: S9 family peptidase [Rheinheimera sp.]|uniref:alpha/beta hydrolase family protein n=1 Tax=Rheinheimera sp. TaxID=1869214 RepID=UPI002F924357